MALDLHALLERAGLEGLQDVPLDRIIPNPANPRRSFDTAELEALAESIVKRGLLQPISLYPLNNDGLHIIRFGERRFRAAGMAGLATIQAFISSVEPANAQIVDQIIENDQRIGLSASEMSDAIHALVEAGMTKAAVAAELGRPASTISLYAALRDMPPPLRALGDTVGIRALHDLYRIWRNDAGPVIDFVATTPADKIDRRSVGELAAGLAPPPILRSSRPDQSSPVASDRGSPTPMPSRRPVAAPCAGDGAATQGSVRVRCPAGEGLLLFPQDGVHGPARVRLNGSGDLVEVRFADIRILAVSANGFA